MRVEVLFFGVLREQMGGSPEPAEIAEGATVGDLLRFLEPRASNGKADSIWRRLAVAVNREYVPASHVLRDGDEVALLPPVSGGAFAPGK